MSKEEKQRGKAAVDLIGAQVGKSGGAWITQALLLVTGTLTQSLPFVMGAFTFIIAVWLRAARQLEKEMKRTEERRTEVSHCGVFEDECQGGGGEGVCGVLLWRRREKEMKKTEERRTEVSVGWWVCLGHVCGWAGQGQSLLSATKLSVPCCGSKCI